MTTLFKNDLEKKLYYCCIGYDKEVALLAMKKILDCIKKGEPISGSMNLSRVQCSPKNSFLG